MASGSLENSGLQKHSVEMKEARLGHWHIHTHFSSCFLNSL